MTNEELQRWVEDISLKYFQRPFLHRAIFNTRLRSSGGRYFPKSHHIDISRMQYDVNGRDEVEKIIKHELCHYHLHLMGRGYKHRDRDFKVLLKQVGGSRFCQPVMDAAVKKAEPYRYKVICMQCGTQFLRKRKVDIRKYACGKCRGKLRLEHLNQ